MSFKMGQMKPKLTLMLKLMRVSGDDDDSGRWCPVPAAVPMPGPIKKSGCSAQRVERNRTRAAAPLDERAAALCRNDTGVQVVFRNSRWFCRNPCAWLFWTSFGHSVTSYESAILSELLPVLDILDIRTSVIGIFRDFDVGFEPFVSQLLLVHAHQIEEH